MPRPQISALSFQHLPGNLCVPVTLAICLGALLHFAPLLGQASEVPLHVTTS